MGNFAALTPLNEEPFPVDEIELDQAPEELLDVMKIGKIHKLAVVQNRIIYNNLIYSYKLDHPDSVASHCNHLGNTNGTPAFPV